MFGKVPCCIIALRFSLAGCTTEWAAEGSYYRTTQTLLDVQSTPIGNILINGSHKGESPLSIPLEYGIRSPLLTRSVPMLNPEAPTSLAQECNDPVSTLHVRDHGLEIDSCPLRTTVQML